MTSLSPVTSPRFSRLINPSKPKGLPTQWDLIPPQSRSNALQNAQYELTKIHPRILARLANPVKGKDPVVLGDVLARIGTKPLSKAELHAKLAINDKQMKAALKQLKKLGLVEKHGWFPARYQVNTYGKAAIGLWKKRHADDNVPLFQPKGWAQKAWLYSLGISPQADYFATLPNSKLFKVTGTTEQEIKDATNAKALGILKEERYRKNILVLHTFLTGLENQSIPLWDLLDLLKQKPYSAMSVADALKVSMRQAYKGLRLLSDAGLIKRTEHSKAFTINRYGYVASKNKTELMGLD